MNALLYQLMNQFNLFKKKINDTITTINNTISSIQSTLTTAVSDIETLKSDVSTNANDIDTLETKVDTNTSDIENIQTKLSSIKGYNEVKNIAAGDTYTIDAPDSETDFTKAVFNIKKLDSDNGVFVDDPNISLTIKDDGSQITIKNNNTTDEDVLINLIII